MIFFSSKEWYVSEFDHKFVFGKYGFGIEKNWSEKCIGLYLFRFLNWKIKWFLNYISFNTLAVPYLFLVDLQDLLEHKLFRTKIMKTWKLLHKLNLLASFSGYQVTNLEEKDNIMLCLKQKTLLSEWALPTTAINY